MKAGLGLVCVVVMVTACASNDEAVGVVESDLRVSTCITVQRAASGPSRVADSYVSRTQLHKNFGDKQQLRVSGRDEALLRFDLSAVPSTATVTKATLKLFANEVGDGSIEVHRVTAPWQEGTVTYANFDQQFAPGSVARIRFGHGGHGHATQKSVDVTGLVGKWVRGVHANYGVLLEAGRDHRPRCERDGDEDRDPTLIASSEGPLNKRPSLEVCYTVFVDECADNPCANGGACTNRNNGFTCACAAGFSGPTCEVVVDGCAANPCLNGGGCTNTEEGYACVCPAGFAGANCETDIDECAGAPCANGGVCSDGVGGYTCACPPGFVGANCETLIDNCEGEPCHNGGACVNGVGGFTCTCATGWSGATCDTNIDDCVGNACVNGTCVDGVGEYACACSAGWGGDRCEVDLDSCAQEPCLNGGACSNGFGSYTCTCAAGFSGTNCEVDIDDCASAPCANGGLCVDTVAGYTCECADGFEGTHCEIVVPPPVRVRVDGVCYAICQSGSGTGWGFENGASCVMAGNPLAETAPFCDTPVPQTAYEAPNAVVTDATTSVAVIPRPTKIVVGPRTGCPQDDPTLVPWNPAWNVTGEAVLPANTRVIVRGNADIPTSVLIHKIHVPASSALVFDDVPATYRLGDVFVAGSLHMGSATCRLESAITVEFDTDEDVAQQSVRDQIVARMGFGFMVGPTGVLELFGHLYQPTWTRLAATANPGDTTVTLAEPVDWRVGDQFVVATGSRFDYPITDENEVRTITAVSGSTVTFTPALAFQHYGGPEYQIEVGLLTRNLVFRTAARVVTAAPTFGGHIMVHSKNARISGVELYGLGQQNVLARYPFHFHRSGDVANASYFTDSSVRRSNYRCAVVHRTDRSLVSRNVAFDNFGHCFYFEDGVEMNNEMSFNLAVRTKFLGPMHPDSYVPQEGFTAVSSPTLAQPADRAASGFYITNGNNKIIGNAASGGFSGFSFPNLPYAIGGGSPERIYPIRYGVSHFDGNTAHSSGHYWSEGGACIYLGGTLTEAADGTLTYKSGRSTEWDLLRHELEVFNNTKTFLCETGIVHWGSRGRIVNFEAHDNGMMAKLFGTASMQSSLSAGASGNPTRDRVMNPVLGRWLYDVPRQGYKRGFQFYDTGNQTILRDMMFRNYRDLPTAGGSGSEEFDQCALLSMTHSNEFTPQRMNSVAGIHYANIDEAMRLCVTNRGTLASRNFNIIDHDGSLSSTVALPPGPRLVASAYAPAWLYRTDCVTTTPWGAVVCPLDASTGVAAIGMHPSQDVRVTTYTLGNRVIGDNWYSPTHYDVAQITAPSGLGWHHTFPSTVPRQFQLRVWQVPAGSFVLASVTLPNLHSCSVPGSTQVASVAALLAQTGLAHTTIQNGIHATCFVRVPPTALGEFAASGLTVPNMTWGGTPIVVNTTCPPTGCAVTSVVPTL